MNADEEDASFYSADDGSSDDEEQSSKKPSHKHQKLFSKKVSFSENHEPSKENIPLSDWNVADWTIDQKQPSTLPKDEPKSIDKVPEYKTCDDVIQQPQSSWFGSWNTILNVASDSVNKITSSVGEGLTTVLETMESQLGAPSPEQMAKLSIEEKCELKKKADEVKEPLPLDEPDDCDSAEDAASEGGSDSNELSSGYQSDILLQQRGSSPTGLITNVSRLLESTGRTLLSGSLDVMENIGKKTFDVITEPVEGEERRKLKFKHNQPALSEILREAAKRKEQASKTGSSKLLYDTVTFDVEFEKSFGAVYMEALKMLSLSQNEQLNSILSSSSLEKRKKYSDEFEKINQSYFDQLESGKDSWSTFGDAQDMEAAWKELIVNNVYNCDKILAAFIKLNDMIDGLQRDESLTVKIVLEKSIKLFAVLTTSFVECFLKTAQLIVAERKTTIDPENLARFTLTIINAINSQAANVSVEMKTLSDNLPANESAAANAQIADLFIEANNCIACLKETSELFLSTLKLTYFEAKFRKNL